MPTVLEPPKEKEVLDKPPLEEIGEPERNPKLGRLLGIPGLDGYEDSTTTNDYGVLVYNDDIHSFMEVEMILQAAIKCSLEKAAFYAQTIHKEGSAIVYTDSREKCEKIAYILEKIKLDVRVVQL